MSGHAGPVATTGVHDEVFGAARDGDRAALEALIRREWPVLRRIVAAADRREADDLTQEAFARVLPRIRRFDDAGAFRAYLSQVARNLVRDRWRRQRFVHPAPVTTEGASDARGPEAEAIAGIDRDAVRRAMGRLSDEHRLVLELRLVEGRSSPEVADVLRRSAPAVRQLQHRALEHLRREYALEQLPDRPPAGRPGGVASELGGA